MQCVKLEGTLRGHLVQLLVKQTLLHPTAQDCVTASKNLQGWRFYNPSEQPAPVLCHPQGKKCSFMFRWKSVLHIPV